jgi:hypothetical protein
MLKARDEHFLGLRKDKYEALMIDKRYLSLTSNQGYDAKLAIKLEDLGIETEVLQHLNSFTDYVR